MRKSEKWCAIALACGMMVGMAGCAVNYVQADTTAGGHEPTITSDMQGETIALLSGEVAEFALNYTKNSAINYAPTDGIATDRYVPKPATISWENSRDDALYYTLRVGLKKDLSDAESYLVSETTADIDYLFAAKHYYYQIYAHYDNDEVVKSRVFDFYTADIPRTVYIEGVTNTRDLGGRYVLGGQYQIKQGMVYRGAEVDRELGAMTEEGRRVMLYELGIKTDLDLRGGDVQNATGTSPIDASLNYTHVEAPWYTHITNATYKEALATEIRTFANPDNYPIYLHCSVGRDRAGTLACLLGALIGVEEVDLYRDYEMTFFSRVGLKDAAQAQGQHYELMGYFKGTIDHIKNTYPAATLMDSAERWAKEYLGITQAEVDSIRNSLWEKVEDGEVEEKTESRAVPSRLNASTGNVATVAENRDFLCTYSANPDKAIAGYGSKEVKTYTAEEAAAAGIPAGYNNEVLEVISLGSNGLCGAVLDFSAEQVPIGLISALEFRVYIGVSDLNTGNYPQVRIQAPNVSGTWVYQVNKAVAMGEWITVTIPYSSNFSYICQDGKLDKFELSLRTNEKVPFYIDSAAYVLKTDDGKAPVIQYTGEDTVAFKLGTALELDVSATDAQEGAIPVQYIWEDGVTLNANGTPTQIGNYTLTLKAVDFFGNVATKTLTVKIVEDDQIAPVIDLKINEVRTVVGVKPMLSVSATDNSGVVTLIETWSDGALDNRGRLTVGEHTWTLTASDTCGNTTTKEVTFFVTENGPAYSLITDESGIYGYCTVTFDGANPVTVPYGFKLPQPADPVKEETVEAKYKFIGWYVGDREWNFETDLVFGNWNLQSKWQETKKVYTVSFDGETATKKVEYGSVIPADLIPEEPQKPATSRKEYTFAGWYLGDQLWNLETDVITGDTALTAKFTESARLYTVTFDGENEQQYEYGAKIVKPENPVKESTATARYEFIGWFYLGKEWNFETDVVNYNINLQSKWNEIAIEGVEPNDSTTQTDSGANTTQSGEGNETNNPLSGCFGVVNGALGGVTALGVAMAVLLKKKED